MRETDKYSKQQRGWILVVCVLVGINLLQLGGTFWLLATHERGVAAPAGEETAVFETDSGPASEPVMLSDSDPLTSAAERAARVAAEQDMQRSRAESQKRQETIAGETGENACSIPAYILTEKGMTLRSLARRYYGSEVFWVCIYDRNIKVLSSPDILPLGIRLKLPRPADYGIDAADATSLQRACELGRSLQVE